MSQREFTGDYATAELFGELGYADGYALQTVPREPAILRDFFGDLLLNRLREVFDNLTQASSKAPQAADAKSATVQIDWWLNS